MIGITIHRSNCLPLLSWFAICVSVLSSSHAIAADASDPVEFNRDIRSFLSNTCYQCHGPDANTREAGLRLDIRESATEDLGGYAAIVPGHADASEVIRRIISEDPDVQMPPLDSGFILTTDQKQLLRRWIDEGATYQRHWSFEPIDRPHSSSVAKANSPIDGFVNDALDKIGLQPNPPAKPLTQLRRVTLDLTGLPPTIEQVDAFTSAVAHDGLDAAYRAAVDRLLESTRFGERMAWSWLEAARYADTDGYQNDGPREMWMWRNWVIDAINANMPFDQFTIEQLAGDLLPDPTPSQLIATAFNRNNRYNSEEGIPINEFLLENAVDRVDTTSTVWMGLTVGCARCHDHKYDPISQKEYYQLIDFFNDVDESGRAVKFGNSEPWIQTPTKSQASRLQALTMAVGVAERELSLPEVGAAQQAWQASLKPPEGEASQSTVPMVADGLDHHFTFDGEDDRIKIAQGAPAFRDGKSGSAAVVGGRGQLTLGTVDGLIGNGRFSLAFWMNPAQTSGGAVLSNEESGTRRSGILIEFVDGRLRWNINNRWISGVSTIESSRPLERDRWVHVTLTNDGTQRAKGMRMYLDGVPQDVTIIRNTNSNAAKRNVGATMSLGYSKHVGFWKGQIDDLRFYTRRTLSPDEASLLAVDQSLDELVALSLAERTTRQEEYLRRAYFENTTDDQHQRLWLSFLDAKKAKTNFADSLPTTMIMQDIPGGRPSHVRLRGRHDRFGEQVHGDTPVALPPMPKPADRLAFARWLVQPNHPLTARVVVNRYWQMLFGKGLVGTAEDFGSQGNLPTHPDLLDWLASQFIDGGWDVKGILRTIVNSDVYRRSSDVKPDSLAIDPENEWLSRTSRLRLPGNVLRDQALFVSGLLVEQVGGPSVYTYQPAGLWREASNMTYHRGNGDDLFRRSLYTYWKRTLSPPTMSLLDTADREWCSVNPRRTNTPLQALTLLNDVTFTESARVFAQRAMRHDHRDRQRLTFLFRSAATRPPTEREMVVLLSALAEYRDHFDDDPRSADKLAAIGESAIDSNLDPIEVAATTALANIILNLDEVTTRD